ncbi:hypothetical protein AXA44_36560 [Rhodococcus sp. SC4]|nr:hypothetical protein AXA44_36560 [Rhodococcus sp. SC4]
MLAEDAAAGLVAEVKGRFKITKPGRDLLAEAISDEAGSIDQQAVRGLYEEFSSYNTEFKQIVTDWQMKGAETPNDHLDTAYDQAVIDRLDDLHHRFGPLVAQFVAHAARLSPYPRRFVHALEQLRDGDNAWFARPIIDSYHTVWFEFHEDLIGLAGLSRLEEAEAGRA